MNLKKTIKPGQCRAMRCVEPDAGAGLCARHAQENEASYPDHVVPIGAPVATPATDEDRVKESLAARSVSIAETLECLPAYEIQSQEDMEYANTLLGEIKTLAKALESERTAVTKPINAALKGINGWFKPVAELYAQAEKILKEKIAEAVASTMQAQDEALALIASVDGESPCEVLALAHGEALIDLPDNVSVREEIDFEIEDAALVPRKFCVPDTRLLKAYGQALGISAVVPGVRYFTKRVVTQRSK